MSDMTASEQQVKAVANLLAEISGEKSDAVYKKLKGLEDVLKSSDQKQITLCEKLIAQTKDSIDRSEKIDRDITDTKNQVEITEGTLDKRANELMRNLPESVANMINLSTHLKQP